MKATEWLAFLKGISARVSFADAATGIFPSRHYFRPWTGLATGRSQANPRKGWDPGWGPLSSHQGLTCRRNTAIWGWRSAVRREIFKCDFQEAQNERPSSILGHYGKPTANQNLCHSTNMSAARAVKKLPKF